MKLGIVESKFADIVWNHEPIRSGELAKLCKEQLEWKRTTTYTVLKKLCDRGIFQNENGVVTSLLSKEEFLGQCGEEFVEETFAGSLPAFIAAFTKRKALTAKEVEEISRMIELAKSS